MKTPWLIVLATLGAPASGLVAQRVQAREQAIVAAYQYVDKLFMAGRRVVSFGEKLASIPSEERMRISNGVRAELGTFESIGECVGEEPKRECHLARGAAFVRFVTFDVLSGGRRARTYVSLRYRTPEGEVDRQMGLELNASGDGRWHVANVFDDIYF